MVDPSLTISIDRTALSLPTLVFNGTETGELGLTDYREPAIQPRIAYAPTSDYVDGDIAMSWSWQQALLDFSFTTLVATEAESRALVAEVLAAVTQGITFEVTVTVSDADPEVWTCNPASLTPLGSRTLADMRTVRPVWNVSLPCHPVRSTA